MKLFTQNSKMRKTCKNTRYNLFNWTLPAIKTCPFADSCKSGCYGNQACYKFSNVAEKHNKNLELSKSDSFIDDICNEIDILYKRSIKRGKQLVIRVHDSGDFYSKDYLNKWIEIIKRNKHVLFYAYTKSIPFFNELQLPSNFRAIYSFGGLYDNLIDVNNDRHAKIFNNSDELKKSGYISAMDNDLIAPKNKKIGLVYHGYKSRKFIT